MDLPAGKTQIYSLRVAEVRDFDVGSLTSKLTRIFETVMVVSVSTSFPMFHMTLKIISLYRFLNTYLVP